MQWRSACCDATWRAGAFPVRPVRLALQVTTVPGLLACAAVRRIVDADIGGTARRVAPVVAALLAFCGLVLILYATSTHLYAGGSDMATTILQGQAMGGGDLLLHGWILNRDSFWTTDALVFAFAVRADGIRPSLLDLGPAVVVAFTVVVGALIARQGRRGGAAVAGVVTVVTLLALSTPTTASSLLAPHVGTALLALVAFAALRKGRFDWRWAVGVAVLAAGILGDWLMVAYGVVPVLLAGFVCMLQERTWRRGAAAVSASVAATVVALVASGLARAMGAFALGPDVQVATAHQIVANLRHLGSYGAGLFGFTNTVGSAGVPAVVEGAHFVGALVVAASSLAALASLAGKLLRRRREPSGDAIGAEGRWLDNVLLIGTLGPAVTFVALAEAGPAGARYLVATILFATVLSGRMVARAWQRLRPGWARWAIGVASAVVCSCFAAGAGYTLAQPRPTQTATVLASFLEAHHLRNGVGDYWAASITTVESREAVTVRPVWTEPDGSLGRSMYQSAAGWYAGQHFQFLVYQTPAYEGVDSASATRTWGPPARSYVVGVYHVLVWSVPFSVPPVPPPPPPRAERRATVLSRTSQMKATRWT
jgi:hypothetical protein